jgi:DNA segregation ATPase FtsK/SpoIIIE, S-DNA-T family
VNGHSGNHNVRATVPDPFARPVLRPPVLHTPLWAIAGVQVTRWLWRLVRFLARHPVVDFLAVALFLAWRSLGWPSPVILASVIAAAAVAWRLAWPASWFRYIAAPMRGRWRRWQYLRYWTAVITISGLAVRYRGRLLLPLLGPVASTGYIDRLHVSPVAGQSAADFAKRADNLAHGFGALACRIRTAKPGAVVIELVRRDALASIIPALPVPDHSDLAAVHVGRQEDGSPWLIRLHGSHVLVAGSTGAGKASVLWAIIRGILPELEAGTARILGADPKLMELAYGRALFDRFGRYESDPALIVAMLEDAVADMQQRASALAGRHRSHRPTTVHPFTVLLVDEVAYLTAYQPDKKLPDGAIAAIATLTTQGRASGIACRSARCKTRVRTCSRSGTCSRPDRHAAG